MIIKIGKRILLLQSFCTWLNWRFSYQHVKKWPTLLCRYAFKSYNDWRITMRYNIDMPQEIQCRNPTLAKCGGEAQHLQSWGFGVLRDSRMFRARQQGPKHLALMFLGVIGKVLKCRYRKWPRIGHLDICSPSYGQKKGRESNWQFDSRPLKVGNRPLPDIWFESATWRWKDLDKGYNFGSDLVAIRLCSRELWPSKVPRV
jgi:hypothetical protein